MNLTTINYSENEDTQAAIAIVRAMIATSRKRTPNAMEASSQSSQTNNEAS